MEGGMMAVGLFEEAKARNHTHDDWERDYVRLQQHTEAREFAERIKGWVSRLAGAFRVPAGALAAVRA